MLQDSESTAGVVANLRTVAVTGQTAAGSHGNFAGFDSPVINDDGDVAFVSGLTDIPGVAEAAEGLFVEQNGNLEFITRTGLTLVGDTRVIQSLFRPRIASNRAVQIGGNFDTGSMVLSNTGGSLRSVAAAGDPLPDLGTNIYVGSNFREPDLSPSGDITFAVDLFYNPDPNNTSPQGDPNARSLGMSLWRDINGTQEILARQLQPAPLTEAGTFFVNIEQDSLITDGDHASFITGLNGPNVTTQNNIAIYSFGLNSPRLVARNGDAIPGSSSGETLWMTNDRVSINGQGEVAFFSRIRPSNLDGIFAEMDGQLRLVVATGTHLPGLPSGAVFDDYQSTPYINDESEVAFLAKVAGTGVNANNQYGMWSEGLGGLHMVARYGQQAGGAATGERFASLFSPYLNSAGQAAFYGRLGLGGSVNSSNDYGIWAESIHGELLLVVREGDTIEVGPGDFRTIEGLTFSGEATRNPFNDLGELVFAARFTDGTSGIFVSNIAAVPEPATYTLALAALCLAMKRNRTR